MRSVYLALVALAVLAPRAQADTSASRLSTWSVSGVMVRSDAMRVNNLANTEPLEGRPAPRMEIRFSDSEGRRYSAVSDAAGRFRLDNVTLRVDGHETLGVTGPLMCGLELAGFAAALGTQSGELRLSIGVVKDRGRKARLRREARLHAQDEASGSQN